MNLAYLAFFLATLPFAMARNRLFGFYYAALYIYSAFAIAGYLYLPGLSESLAAYFGDEVGRTALLFTFASMAGFWSVNMLIYRKGAERRASLIAWHANAVTASGTAIFAAIVVIFIGLLVVNFSTLSWYIFEETDSLPLQTSLFLAMFKTVVGILTTGYLILRSPEIRTDRIFAVFYALLLIAFLVASIRLGNRTDPTALLIAMVLFEALSRKLRLRVIAGIGVAILVGVLALSAIEYFRYTDGGASGPLLERIVRNDYYAPAHMLIATIAFDFVDPATVIRSNSANALILFGEPYLQQTITELFRVDIATRSAGYAFYIMTEGWMFAGWGGIIYNAIIPSAGLWLWNRLASTNNRFANLLVQMLVASMLLNVTRGQSSYFIKYLYTFILPNIALAVVIVGLRFRLPRGQIDATAGYAGVP
jgi:hypothetical protein